MATVYFFKVGDKELFKIGKTTVDPEKRLKAVSTGSAYPLEIYKLIEHEAHSKLEVFLLKFFKDNRADNIDNKIEELKTMQNKDTVLEPTPEAIEIYNNLIDVKTKLKT